MQGYLFQKKLASKKPSLSELMVFKRFSSIDITVFLKDSAIYWKLRADATTDGKFSISNMANLFLLDKVIDPL